MMDEKVVTSERWALSHSEITFTKDRVAGLKEWPCAGHSVTMLYLRSGCVT